jgi:hypothetical protein
VVVLSHAWGTLNEARLYAYANPDVYNIGPRFVVGGEIVCWRGEHQEFMSTRLSSKKLFVVTTSGVKESVKAETESRVEIDKDKSIDDEVPIAPGSSTLSAFQKPKAQVSVGVMVPP